MISEHTGIAESDCILVYDAGLISMNVQETNPYVHH